MVDANEHDNSIPPRSEKQPADALGAPVSLEKVEMLLTKVSDMTYNIERAKQSKERLLIEMQATLDNKVIDATYLRIRAIDDLTVELQEEQKQVAEYTRGIELHESDLLDIMCRVKRKRKAIPTGKTLKRTAGKQLVRKDRSGRRPVAAVRVIDDRILGRKWEKDEQLFKIRGSRNNGVTQRCCDVIKMLNDLIQLDLVEKAELKNNTAAAVDDDDEIKVRGSRRDDGLTQNDDDTIAPKKARKRRQG